VLKSDRPEPGLVAWWAFDEADDDPVTYDYAGNNLGGRVEKASRTDGIDGRALACRGGCVVVDSSRLLAPSGGMTIECWVRTDTPGQNDAWFLNRIYGGSTATGYRFGLAGGRPCFAVPLTDWSHHLVGDAPLPTGRWVHLAGTCDGEMLRLYLDGRECGSMPRPGEVRPNDRPLCLGNYDVGHRAHFTGDLDEVRLYSRALPPVEILAHSQRAGR
jgi:hypothetical protein